MQDKVILSGIDKITKHKVTISMITIDFEDWMNGIPVKYAVPGITEEERRFLSTGTTTV
jgi:hypothetical protein